MKTVNPLPLTTFSQVDYPIELENMFDIQQNQTFTLYNTTDATFTYSGDLTLVEDEAIYVSIIQVDGDLLEIYETIAEVLTVPSGGTFTARFIETSFGVAPPVACSYRISGDTTPKDVTFKLQPSGGSLVEFKIRANSEGKGKVFIGEILRTYLPEFLAPKDYETDSLEPNSKTIEILFNGQEDNNLGVFYGSKYLNYNRFYTTAALDLNPLGQIAKLFKEQLTGYIYNPATAFKKIQTADYLIGLQSFTEGLFTSNFNLYPAIPCRKKIYLSANYGLLPDGDLIDVSVPVLAFINRAGQYEYIRFTGSNVNKYNVQEARLKQDYAGTLTNADTGLIYEGIELTLADDGENTDFPYIIDKLELQRCRALLMESPKAWLLVNGELQQCLEVRVKRESVRFATSFDKSRDNFTAQCEVIVCQPLGNPQY